MPQFGGEQRVELGAFVGRRVVRREIRGMLELRDDRLQRAALVMGLAKVAQADMWVSFQSLFQRRGQAGFADARFAGEKDDAAFAVFDLLPAALQQIDFLLPPDQRCPACRPQGFKPACDRALTHHPPDGDGVLETLQCRRRERLVFE